MGATELDIEAHGMSAMVVTYVSPATSFASQRELGSFQHVEDQFWTCFGATTLSTVLEAATPLKILGLRTRRPR